MFPLFELVRILDLENLYQIPVHGTNAIDHTEQAIDVLAPPDIKLFATTNCAERSLLAILCSDGSLVVHYCVGAAPAVVRRLEWNLDMLSEVVAMTFDPSGTWLLCAVQTAGIYILPILSAMDPGVKINQMWNLKDVTEILKYKGTKAQPTSVAWWNTLDDIHVGIIANKLGEVTFVDLVKGKELCGTYIPEEIEQMELYTNNEQTTTYLLLTSCVGAQWKLLLERKLESSPRRSFAEKFNFFVRHRTSECILGVSDSHPRFLPVKMQDDGGNVFTAYAKSRYLLAKQNFKDGLLRMYDGIEQEAPVFIYRVPKDCGKVLVTDHLLFTLADDTVLVLSNQQSESYTEAKQSFKEESKVQQFSTSQMGKDLKIVRRNYPFYLHKQREHARLQEMGRTVPGEASSAKQQVVSADIMLTLKEKCDKKARGLTKKITVPPNTPNRASPDATVPLQPAKADDNVVFHVHIDEAEVAECADMEHIDDVAQAIATGNLGIIRRSSSSEDMGAVIEGAFDSLPLIALEHHTVFTGCLIVGRRAVYECRPRISPERMFLDLTIDNYDIDVTELLGISLGLDLYLLYELAGDFYLEQGQFCHAIYLYQVSKSPYVRVIYNFVKHNHIGKILAYVSNLLSNSKMYMTLVDREQLANIALLCFTHEVIDHQSRSSVWLETSFREFLNTTTNYDCQLALELLSRYAMYDLLFLLAKRCGLMPQMLQLLSSQGHMRTDDTDVYDDTHALVVVPESLIHCMTTSDVVMQLLALPQAALQYMQLVVSQVALLDEDTLLHLALQFDPSRAAMKPFLSRAVQHRKRTMDGSMSSVASETVIDFVGAEREPTTATARELCVEDAIEFYLTVLLALVAQQRRRFGRSAGAKTLRFDATFAHAGDGADKELIERDTVIVSCQPVSVAAGHSHSAVVVAGELYTWGKTDRERLGHKNTQGVLESPQRVYKLIGLDVIAVSCGNAHTVALTNTGVYTWGSDTYGQLGLGMNETGGPPRIVQALAHVQCVSVVCGQYHTLALTSTGRVYSWGWGVHGQLGHGTADDCHLPTYIRALEGVVVTTVCAGYAHSAILDEMGQVFTFGCGAYGQLGLGPAISMKLTTPYGYGAHSRAVQYTFQARIPSMNVKHTA
ncbi:PREDICTED: uncharacterized protein LOC106807909 [Priapulus caudatus]|uniref:Uncharacterized protein LOC106807909 n=1 Tax=Priapulus caudatus TaxID=37621 RepID=A0ABM1E139_PRICU|nr:PREDICTED: uncharacterized protein LOC106807909 [Priapulus caudatus]